jgi:hypothetical protein
VSPPPSNQWRDFTVLGDRNPPNWKPVRWTVAEAVLRRASAQRPLLGRLLPVRLREAGIRAGWREVGG